MGKNFKVGDPVRATIKHLSTFGKSGTVKSTDENFVYVEFDNLPGTYTFQSESLELIQEEPMHPYLTPEKIEELAAAVVRKISDNKSFPISVNDAVRIVLEREANPPQKVKTFTVTVTIPIGKRDVTSERIKDILTDSDYDRLDPAILVAVDEVTP